MGSGFLNLEELVIALNREFDVESFGKDPGFSRFIPAAYESTGFKWQEVFEKRYTELFNGLMIKGTPEVSKVFLAVFPTDEVLEYFIRTSTEGDLLFMHHSLLMECGDPNGEWGRGFVPIKEEFLNRIIDKKLSVYTVHEPLDFHRELGTSVAIQQSLGGRKIDGFLPGNNGEDLVFICEINEIGTDDLVTKLEKIFEIPYVDLEGKKHDRITKVAIVAGCGDKVDWMKEAEKRGVQAYITGEIHCHIDNDYGKRKYQQMMDYVSESNMSLIGVSHSASEYLVKKTLIRDWFHEKLKMETILVPQGKWWL
jgi:putative NIF3 family GTP cyclohydrolase 1 type 2